MKKEINGKMYELVDQTEECVCSGCVAANDKELCEKMGDECITIDTCDKVWKEAPDANK